MHTCVCTTYEICILWSLAPSWARCMYVCDAQVWSHSSSKSSSSPPRRLAFLPFFFCFFAFLRFAFFFVFFVFFVFAFFPHLSSWAC